MATSQQDATKLHVADRQTAEKATIQAQLEVALSDYVKLGGCIIEVDYAATGDSELGKRWDIYKQMPSRINKKS